MDMGIKTVDLYTKGTWTEVVDDCRSTVKKPPLGHEPSHQFKEKIMIAEHSPIRDIAFRWKWENMKYWIAMHWKTHHWESKVSTQRSDRTGVSRDKLPQDSPVDFVGEANVQSLIDTMRKRLCYQASPETRAYAEDLKKSITDIQPEIGKVLVPNCVYRCGCPEPSCCGYFQRISEKEPKIMSTDISERYEAYDSFIKQA